MTNTRYKPPVGRYIIDIEFKTKGLLSLIHSEGDFVDHVILVKEGSWGEKDKPMISGSSFAGVLRRLSVDLSEELNILWGKADNDDDDMQSQIIISNFICEEDSSVIEEYTANKINNNSHITEINKLYSYEYVPEGTIFSGQIHINKFDWEENENPNLDYRKAIGQLISTIKSSEFSLGGKKNIGYGQIDILSFKCNYIDLKNDLEKWLDVLSHRGGGHYPKIDEKFENLTIDLPAYEPKNSNKATFSGTFCINNALLIGGGDSADADKTYMKSKGKALISTKTIAGALKARMRMWGRTNKIENEDLENLLGNELPKKENGKGSIKSRFIMKYASINEDPSENQIQTRNAIDPFTGGTKNTALFNSQPIWEEECQYIKMSFAIKPPKTENLRSHIKDHEWEIGLLLYMLRDLCYGDLPIGGEKNIGRGRLSLKKGSLFIKEENGENSHSYHREDDEITVSNHGLLEKYIVAFQNYKGKK